MDSTSPPSIEALLRHRTWLRRLAASLVIDAARADDVAQEAFLKALQTPPRSDAHPRAWLATVARRIARQTELNDERRATREEFAARPERQPAADEVVAKATLHRALVDAVLALEEPYRTAVLLRFFENLPPRAIARRTEAPIETVRTRLKRGIELVRARIVSRERRSHDATAMVWTGLVELLDRGSRRLVARTLAKSAASAATASTGMRGFAVVNLPGMSMKLYATILIVVAAGVIILEATTGDDSKNKVGSATARGGQTDSGDPVAASQTAARASESREPIPGSNAWLSALGISVTPSPVGGVPVVVTFKSTNEPAPDVVVIECDEGLDPAALLAPIERAEELRRVRLAAHRTDEEGTAAVRLSRTMRTVFAAEGELHAAYTFTNASTVPIALPLAPTTRPRVKVLDESGNPSARVLVGLGRLSYEPPRVFDPVETSPDGVATLFDLSLRTELFDRKDWVVAIDGLFTPPSVASIDLDRVPADPVVLMIGSAGAMDFRVVDENDVPIEVDGDSCDLLFEADRDESRRGPRIRMNRRLNFRSGHARVAPIGLGLKWSLSMDLPSRAVSYMHDEGPTRDGEEIAITIRAEPKGPIFVGRLLDRNASALANHEVLGWHSQADERNAGGVIAARTSTDGDGRFELDFHSAVLDVFRRRLTVFAKAPDGRRLRGVVDPPQRLQRGTIELGDIVADEVFTTFSGRVVRDDGLPMSDAHVWIRWQGNDFTPDEVARFGSAHYFTDASGSFEIFGWPAGRYQVSCKRHGFDPPLELRSNAELTLPIRDMTLTLDRAYRDVGWILGRISCDDWGTEARASLVATLRRRANGFPIRADIEDDGKLRASLPPGVYDFTLSIGEAESTRELIARIDGLDVKADQVNIDPRLRPLDLSDTLHVVTVCVLDPEGTPASNVFVGAVVPGSGGASARFRSGTPPIRFFTTHPALDLEAMGPHGLFAQQSLASGDVTLRLTQGCGIQARVVIDPPELARSRRYSLVASLAPEGSRFESADWLIANFDAEGAATLQLPRAGNWNVHLQAASAGPIGRRVSELLTDKTITIPFGASETTCEFHFDQKQLDAIAEAAKGD